MPTLDFKWGPSTEASERSPSQESFPGAPRARPPALLSWLTCRRRLGAKAAAGKGPAVGAGPQKGARATPGSEKRGGRGSEGGKSDKGDKGGKGAKGAKGDKGGKGDKGDKGDKGGKGDKKGAAKGGDPAGGALAGASGPGTAWVPEKGTGLKLQFDVAVHVRTQPKMLESARCKEESAECQQQMAALRKADDERMEAFKDPQGWACMSALLSELQEKKASASPATGAPPPHLNVFLATDNESLRPLFIRFLSPHGAVFFSSGSVAHTSKSVDALSKLQTMTEFYLLSRAHVMVSYNKYVSTFALFSSIYSNATLLARHPQPNPKNCHFKMEHFGEAQG